MKHTVHKHPTDGCLYYRFPTGKGTVWVKVIPQAAAVASLTFAEQESAMAAAWMDDVDAFALPEIQAQFNRFGTGCMLRIFKTVRDSMPEIREWIYERKAGANPGFRSRRGSDAVHAS